MKLLIVDDNENIRSMLKDILKNIFDEFVEHDDGQYAELICEKERPDFILMDVKMKTMDGITATKNILSQNSKAKIIIISQYNDEQIINDAYAAGAVKFFSKENLLKLEKFFNNQSF